MKTLPIFISGWKRRIPEIKKSKFSQNQISLLYKDFSLGLDIYDKNRLSDAEFVSLLTLITDVKLAFEVAYSNYRDEKGILWKLFRDEGLKLPDIHVHRS